MREEATMEGKTFDDEALQAELDRRLDLMTSPDYDDPAREDFSARDFAALAILVIVLCVGFFLWGY